jgi:predicted GIY-YIG superfamily endonuclease
MARVYILKCADGKGWSRAKKEALIKGDWKLIQAVAKQRGGKIRDSS